MQTFLRTVDLCLCIYPLGRAITNDDWNPGEQVRITIDESGIAYTRNVYYINDEEPKQIQKRIQAHLTSRITPDQCSVIELDDCDGFEARKSRILDLNKARTQKQIDNHETLHINMDSIHKKDSTIEKAMASSPLNHAKAPRSRIEESQTMRTAGRKKQIEKNICINALFFKIRDLETTLRQYLNHQNQSNSTTDQPERSEASTKSNQQHHWHEEEQCPIDRIASVLQISTPIAQQFLNAMRPPERLKVVRLIIVVHLLSKLANEAEALQEYQQLEDILSYLEHALFHKSADH